MEMRHRKRLQQLATVGVRVHAHAAVAGRGKRGKFLAELAGRIEKLARTVAQHPGFELLQVRRIGQVVERHLVRAPGPLHRQAVDEFRPRPAFRRAENDHRPAWPLRRRRRAVRSGVVLYPADARQDAVEGLGQPLVNERRIVALNEVRLVAVAAQQLGEFVAADAREHRRVGDLEAVEVQDRQHGAVPAPD